MLMANGTIRPKARVGGHIALALLLLMACASAKAQKEKACLISVGHVDILDTYLSQEKATGLELRYNKERLNRKLVACGDTAGTRLRKWSTFVSQEALVSKAGTRGNYDHNVVFTSPASGLQIQQQLLLDFRLWRTTFTVGYLNDIRQLSANSLKYHQYTHAVTIGWRY